MAFPNGQYAAALEDCISKCVARTGCVLVDWVAGPKACYVKSSVGYVKQNAEVWGARPVSAPSVSSVAAAATGADTTITVGRSQQSLKSIAAASSSVPPSPVSSASASSGTGKRGLCFNPASDVLWFGGSGSKVTRDYNWYSDHNGTKPNAALQYSPMLWGLDGGHTLLSGFNEPDLTSQSSIALSAAVAGWETYMEPFAGRAKLVSPAVTNGGPPSGLTYLHNFIGNCSGSTIDAVAIHCYAQATNIAYFQNYIQSAYAAAWNRPLWLTEFGASGTDAQIKSFFDTVLPWHDCLPYVERYAYFYAGPSTSSTTYLVNQAGTALSDIGAVFNTL